MTTNSQLSTTEPKNQKQKQTKQTTRTGTESQNWRSQITLHRYGELSAGMGKRDNG